MATTQIKDGYQGGSDSQLLVNDDGSINTNVSGEVVVTGPIPIEATDGSPINPGQQTMGESLPVVIASDQTNTPWALRLDNGSVANVMFIGIAATGSSTADPAWQIKKVDQTTGIVITWAGNAAYDQIWDDHLILVYT